VTALARAQIPALPDHHQRSTATPTSPPTLLRGPAPARSS